MQNIIFTVEYWVRFINICMKAVFDDTGGYVVTFGAAGDNSMYRMLALDIDDTLLKTGQNVSPKNKEAIARARDAGIYIAIATGRSFLGTKRVMEQLGLSGLSVNYGGAVITDAATGKPVFFSEMNSDLIIEVLELAKELGIHAHIYQDDKVISETKSKWVDRYTGILSLQLVIDPDIRQKSWKNIPKVLYMTEEEHVDELIPMLKKRFEGRLKVSGSTAGFIEFNVLGEDKGTGIKRIAKIIGAAQSEVAAIGDNTLDIEMIEWAGLGAAVANAKPAVLELADVITPSCEEDGVAWLIDNYLI